MRKDNFEIANIRPGIVYGISEKSKKHQRRLQESTNKADSQDDQNQPLEELVTHLAAILISGYDKEISNQSVFDEDIRLVKEALISRNTLFNGMSPENVYCTTLANLKDTIDKVKDKELVKGLLVYYSGHFCFIKGFQFDNKKFIPKEDFKELLKAIKQNIVLVTDCCFSGQLKFWEPNTSIRIQIGSCGPNEKSSFDLSGSAFTKIFVHCLKGNSQSSPCPLTNKLPCQVCEEQKPKKVRNGQNFISIDSFFENIKAHSKKRNASRPETSNPFLNGGTDECCIL